MERSTQRPGFDERAVAPECIANVLLRDPFDAGSKLQLGGGLHLCMDPTDLADDLDEPLGVGTLGQMAAPEPPPTNLVPGNGDQLEKALTVDERPAPEPRQGWALEDLKMRSCRIVFLMIRTVLRDPRAHVVVRAHARDPLAVHQEVVLRR